MNKKGIVYIVLTILLFTSMEPVSKLLAISGIQSAEMTFLRFALGGLALFPFALVQLHQQGKQLHYKDYLTFLLMGSLGIALSMVLLQIAIERIPAATAAIIFCCNPIFTTAFAVVLLKESFNIKKLIAMLFCFIGILLCIDFKADSSLYGILLATGAAVLFSLYSVIGKKLMSNHTAIVQNSFSFVSGSTVLLLILLLRNAHPIGNVTMANLPLLLYLGIGVSGLGYLFYFLAMKETSATTASVVFSIKPVLAPFFSFLLLGDPINGRILIAMFFVLVGSFMNFRNNKTQLNTQPAEADTEAETAIMQ